MSGDETVLFSEDGGNPWIAASAIRVVAPDAIHTSMIFVSAALKAGFPSAGMKSLLSGGRVTRRKSSLLPGSPGWITKPSFPPRITCS